MSMVYDTRDEAAKKKVHALELGIPLETLL